MERTALRQELVSKMELISDYILIRHPSIPRYYDPIARPYVAIITQDVLTGEKSRKYVSQGGPLDSEGREPLVVADIDQLASQLQSGTLLEVRFNSMRANLYKLEILDDVPCWRWIGKYRGHTDFDYPSAFDWFKLVDEEQIVTPREASI